ncbi:MAG TPA: FISUMP domain-containing protein, partial [Fibrobacteria bacterium]|nr:FISUMP domain-containing protein [Fibrobacteria bacterium]
GQRQLLSRFHPHETVKSHNNYAWNGGLPRQGICPSGWHVPVDTEWNRLMTTAGGSSVAGGTLRATKGWGEYLGRTGNGTDAYGFRLLPNADPIVNAQGEIIQTAMMRSATETNSGSNYYSNDWYVSNQNGYMYQTTNWRVNSIGGLRCIAD